MSISATNSVLEWSELSNASKLAIKKRSSRSFLDFTRIWFELLQGDKLLVNWHHRMMADRIDDLISGKNPGSLIINLPPGGTKTEFFSIHFPAYQYVHCMDGNIKKFRNLNISFADTLVKRNSRRTRDILDSGEFRELWPVRFGVNQAEEWEVLSEDGKSIGQTVSRGSGGQITGGRAGYFGPEYSGAVMLDDYNKPDDMFSETKRNAANRKLVNTVRSRRGDKSDEHPTPFVSIQQRLHVNDATGFMLSGDMGIDFECVEIPALIDEEYIQSLEEPYRTLCWNSVKDTKFKTVSGVKYWSYWPEMESVDDLVGLWERDDYTFLSQYMQKPIALTGGLLNSDWFQRYTELPELQWRAVFVDTNSGKVADHNDWTVFTLAGLGVDGNLYIIDVERGKWDPEELLEKAVEVWDRWSRSGEKSRIRYMAIEDKQAGQGLITTLKKKAAKKSYVIPVEEIPRGNNQNKVVRCKNVTPQIKGGEVFVPALYTDDGEKLVQTRYSDGSVAGTTDWVMQGLKEASDFSVDDSHPNDDILDTWMDAIDRMLIGDRTRKGFFT